MTHKPLKTGHRVSRLRLRLRWPGRSGPVRRSPGAGGCLCGLALCLAVVGFANVAYAQKPGEAATDPIRCWWKTDRNAVRIGERFTLSLTCSVVETSSVKVVPVVSQIDPGAIQLTPFEVVGGRRGDDVVAAPWRYIQYEYTLRLLGEGFFGQDVSIPALTVTYNVRAAAGNGAEGRDQQYILPPIPVRVLSIVPQSAADIRDASRDSFADIESRRFRATGAFVAAMVSFALAGLLVIFAGLRMFGRVRSRRSASARPLASPLVLSGALRALREVKAEVMRDGWSPALARRALGALRVAGAVAVGRDVTQTNMSGDAAVHDGQIVVRSGIVRRRRSVVSAAVTPDGLARELASGRAPRGASHAAAEQLRSALQMFGTAGYGRAPELDRLALDTALDSGMEAVKRLRLSSLWPGRLYGPQRPGAAEVMHA